MTTPTASLAELEKKMDDRHDILQARLEQLNIQVGTGMEELRSLLQGPSAHSNNGSPGDSRFGGSRRTPPPSQNLYATRISKVEFPRFNGKNVRDWLYKCDQFFMLDGTPATEMVRLASIHLDGLALQWHLNYMRQKFDYYPTWQQYVSDVTTRFGDAYEDPLSALLQVKHTAKVQDYVDQFELALTQVTLLPEHSLSIFLAGLDHGTQMHVRMFSPSSIAHAANLAKLHEASKDSKPVHRVSAFSKYSPASSKSLTSPSSNSPTTLPTPSSTTPNPKPLFSKTNRTFSAAEMEERRAKGLCMFCDEVFTPGHQLKHKRSHLMVMELDEEEPLDIDTSLESSAQLEAVSQFDSPQLSLQALTGVSHYQTMRVTGMHDKKVLHILLDSGSTHNFLDLELAKKLGCKLEAISPLAITSGGGHKLEAAFVCKSFKWLLQQTVFMADVIVLPLGCSDLILGIQWLKSLGPILWDFDKLQMEFTTQGRKFVLRGAKTPSIKLVNNKSFAHAVQNGAELCLMTLNTHVPVFDVPTCLILSTADGSGCTPPLIDQLLHVFQDIFTEPSSLPPHRVGFDHKIPLKDGSEPFNLKPYRYSLIQKTIIDNLVDVMLDQGIIQHSTSPFSSPTVLVRKKDGSWRLCVDFRRLNQFTIKDRFPIPLIEDLLDELAGASIFSKLDLKSGYHQLRMAEGEEHKTAFKTHSGHFEFLVMPFGLTNAPASFQSLMNHLFKPFLRRFVIIFFDDLLVYSKSLQEHIEHLSSIFKLIRVHQLFLNRKKCSFGTERVEYLGHFITKEGVSTDPAKIQAVRDWPFPKNPKQLRGFLGLAGYYRRFVKDFGKIAKPLTDMLKRDSFLWSSESTAAFTELKQALISAPLMRLPDFSQKFVVETDASGKGIGAVLMQQHHPIAYISKSLGPKQQAMSVYERELLAIVYAVQKWGAYLSHAPFIIKTDQRSIKHILDQKLNTSFQQAWVAKLMGFDFEIQYKEGAHNLAADALSRREGAELLPMLLNSASPDLYESIKASWTRDPSVQKLIADLVLNHNSHPKFSWVRNELRRRGKLVIGQDPHLKNSILRWLHDSSVGGHSGRDITAARVKSLFYWKGMAKDIQIYVRNCAVCQRNKADLSASPGLLQPLPIPSKIWVDISMDFIEGLPPSAGKQVIFVVVDRLSKYAHFIPLSHPYTAVDIAKVFLDNVFKLHGLPESITSDRDPIFLSTFWNEFFKLQGVALNKSTAYHPQSDGQTEIVNKAVETYLRCMCSEKPTSWSQWIPMAEYWYNSNFHSAIQTTPYEVVYGQPPPIHLPYLPGASSSVTVDGSLLAREEAIKLLKFHLLRAQNRMIQQADKHRSDRKFEIGDFVYLKLHPYRQLSVKPHLHHKLLPKFFGPFKVIDKVGHVAYQLELPSSVAIHNVFHVSQLKLCPNPASNPIVPIPAGVDQFHRVPEAILDRKMVKRGRTAATKVLVKWQNTSPELATWEFYYDLLEKFPNFHP
ncbi:retrotransposon-related protein [Trifolium pratense]|uniref:Retrotransposon-related protein n=1 Tax=Trifolium pratense TaxID=57577 RepID=A0A2K3MNA7_TRIPR|nr:retrotransposon-related protein [Trifolium pratense]